MFIRDTFQTASRTGAVRPVYALLGLVLLLVGLGFGGCDDDDDDPVAPPVNIYEPAPDAPPQTGRLYVYVFGGQRYEPQAGAEVSVYANFEDFERDIRLNWDVTSRDGRIDFGYLNIGNYYIYSYLRNPRDTVDYTLLERIQIQDGQALTRNVVLY